MIWSTAPLRPYQCQIAVFKSALELAFFTAVPNRQDRARGQTGTLLGRVYVFLLASCCGYKSEGMVDGQAKDDESGPVQAEKLSLVSGGLLRMISPVSDTFK
jgi:hypothetical protein